VGAFPVVVAPFLLLAAQEHGARFAGDAADGTLLGLIIAQRMAVTALLVIVLSRAATSPVVPNCSPSERTGAPR